ncbi:MAG: GDSL-type esterase/lipase family protein, partial [Egibacteraceae bacterium]
ATVRRVAVLTAVGAPLALLAVLGVEVWLGGSAEYLPTDPGYTVEATVHPAGGGSGAPVRMVMLGDSTVAGVGSPTVDESLAVLVGQRMANRLGRPVEVRGLGVSGARTLDVQQEQIPQLVDADADVVVIVVGSNDVTHATPPWTFAEHTRTMLKAAAAASGGAPVVLGGIPLFGSADALAQPLRAVVDGYAAVLRARQQPAAEAAGATFVPIADEASPRFAGVPEAMSSDGFHPGPVGYGFWADAIAPRVASALRT